MGIMELLLIAVGLSMDAFAAAICAGVSVPKVRLKRSLVVGLYFGAFQAAMPAIGYLLGTQFADAIAAFDHWIAFALLGFIGGKMAVESFKKTGCPDRRCPETACTDRPCPGKSESVSLGPKKMLPLAVATSIDALAAGVSFALFDVNIGFAAALIGATTLLLSMLGVKIGNLFGLRMKSKAELAGGIILILMGLKLLLEHTGVIGS